jgi:hypothetical protein
MFKLKHLSDLREEKKVIKSAKSDSELLQEEKRNVTLKIIL